MKKIALAAALALSSLAALPVHAAGIQDKYNKSCAACHASGVAGAPKKGDKAAWGPRLKKGDAALLKSVQNGFKAMPPKGLCMDCSDADYKALIAFMSK